MLHDARIAAMRKLQRGIGVTDEWLFWTVRDVYTSHGSSLAAFVFERGWA